MGTRDLDFFMEHPDEFETLSAEDQAKVFEGRSIEGEISSVPPDAAAQTASEPEGDEEAPEQGDPQADAGEKPAVLAKDGKHFIPFEELETAREQARQWKHKAEEAAAVAERLSNSRQGDGQQVAADTDTSPPAAQAVDLDDLEMQAEDASTSGDLETYRALRKQINAEVERRAVDRAIAAVEQREAQERQRAVETAVQAEASRAIAQHPFLDHQGPNPNWEAIAQVQALRDLYAADGKPMDKALADAVAKVVPMYSAFAEPPKSESSDQAISAKAAAAIAKAKASPPNSMSSIPSASVPHHDESAAMLEMSPMELSQKFASMTPEQIERALARVL